MHQRSCDLCQNSAVIHDTIVRGGVVKVRHLCRTHGLKLWRDAVPVPAVSPQALQKDPVYQSLVAEAGEMLHRRGEAGPTPP